MDREEIRKYAEAAGFKKSSKDGMYYLERNGNEFRLKRIGIHFLTVQAKVNGTYRRVAFVKNSTLKKGPGKFGFTFDPLSINLEEFTADYGSKKGKRTRKPRKANGKAKRNGKAKPNGKKAVKKQSPRRKKRSRK